MPSQASFYSKLDAQIFISPPSNMKFGTGEPPSTPGDSSPILTELEIWAEKYLAVDGNDLGARSDLVREVQSGEVNHMRTETEIQLLIPSIVVTEGFYEKCPHQLCHWPDLPDASWASAPERSFDTISKVQAAARAGCKFCTFILSRSVQTKLLGTFKKVEWRLSRLGHDGTTSLTIQNWYNGPRGGGRSVQVVEFAGQGSHWIPKPGGNEIQFLTTVVHPTCKNEETPTVCRSS
jgi:hypothetical protein